MPVASGLWYLEGFADGGKELRRVPLLSFPFRVGRRASLDLSLSSTNVSHRHAELFEQEGALMVRDLHSTNGTFVNRHRLSEPQAVAEGDVLHFANLEFRLGRIAQNETGLLAGHTSVVEAVTPRLLIADTENVRRLVTDRAVTPLFQPIVALRDDAMMGYEVLGRGNHPELPTDITELFELASYAGVEGDLSRLFRAASIEAACQTIEPPARLFFNTHPAELKDTAQLLVSLESLRAACPDLPMALEIHEAAVTDPASLRELKRHLGELGVELAYDDFGVGQARLLELADAPPDYLKFDLSFIRDIDRAPAGRRRVVEGLVKLAHELEIQLIAEGVESGTEAEACRRLGFQFGQGFYYGVPAPFDQI